MDFHKYTDIDRLKDKYAMAFKPGEQITISEKIDGSNASFDGGLSAFSRRKVLDAENTLNGFYGFVQSLDAAKVKEVLGENLIVFGEWLVKHTVKYPEDKMHKFYAFDVWNKETEQYLPWNEAKKVIAELGLNTAPIFYEGPFTSWEDIQKFVGKTEMGAEPCGEGIVIKSQDRLDNRSSNTPAYVKIVDARFSEVKGQKEQKQIDPEKLAAKQAQEALAATIVTERRVEKLLQKMVEDGVIPADWDEHDMGTIAKNLPKAMYADCVKEEPETVAQVENFGKIAAGISMKLVKGLIK
jgi:hypothetical protein